MLGSIQICGERLAVKDIDDLCHTLHTDSVRLLSLRECHTTDEHFHRFSRALSTASSLLQLNLNLGIVCSLDRVKHLAVSLMKNRTLTALL